MQVQGKILVVDDDPNNITIVEELLDDNYDLRSATTGEQALEITQDFPPDVILLDIMMPGMNGYEVCRRLREHNTLKHTKIIMVSARAMVSERLEGYKVGADDYITKPFDGDEFLAKVHVYLRLKYAEKRNQMWHEITITLIDELRTPVIVAKNIISDVTGYILEKINPKLHHQLEIANKCIDYLERTISNFLDISEIYAGKVELQLSLFSMQSVVSEVVNILNPKTTLRKIDLNTDMPTKELLVNADRQKIAKILTDLIGDAIRVTHEGDSIHVRVKDLKDRISVDVEGNGLGGESSEIDELFDRPAQIEEYVGSGRHSTDFELAVAKGLVELHGGRIWVENQPEGGIVFSFDIPICTETETTTQPTLSGAGANSGACA